MKEFIICNLIAILIFNITVYLKLLLCSVKDNTYKRTNVLGTKFRLLSIKGLLSILFGGIFIMTLAPRK